MADPTDARGDRRLPPAHGSALTYLSRTPDQVCACLVFLFAKLLREGLSSS